MATMNRCCFCALVGASVIILVSLLGLNPPIIRSVLMLGLGVAVNDYISNVNYTQVICHIAQDEQIFLEGAFPALWILKTGTIRERLQAMSHIINNTRTKMIEEYISAQEWTPLKGPLRVIDGVDINHLKDISISGDVIPIFLPWVVQHGRSDENPWNTLTDKSNLLIQKYYQWIGEPRLCNWINSGITNMRYHVVHNSKCVSDRTQSLKPQSLHLITLNSRPANKLVFPTFPPSYYTDIPKHVVYILMATNAVFTVYGDLITQNTKYAPYTCSHDNGLKYPDTYEKATLYDEVFSIAQYWGSGFYHKNIEDYPRIAPFLPWLRENPQIKIHVFENGAFTATIMGYLGITKDRLVGGPLRARFAYMPETSFCGFSHVTNTQILSAEYRDVIHNKFNQTKRGSIVHIRRSGHRRLTKHNEVEAMLRKVAQEYDLDFELFIDNPPPAVNEAMMMFNRAVMVVAPHGAGLANLIFSEAETFVIEGVCNRPHVNLCFQRLIYALGHHYHAIQSNSGCEGSVNINTPDIENIVRTYIPHAAKLKRP